jgi:hypothetical protein
MNTNRPRHLRRTGIALLAVACIGCASQDQPAEKPTLTAITRGLPPVGNVLLGALAYSGYLYSNPEAMQREKPKSVVVPESPPSGNPPYRGWVFFPTGNYREVILIVRDMSEYKEIDRLKLAWKALPSEPGEHDQWLAHGTLPSGLWSKYGPLQLGNPK